MNSADIMALDSIAYSSSTHEMIIKHICAGLLSGKYAPGDKLSDKEICNELEISRTPLREAYRVLQTMGETITFRTPTTSGESLVDDLGHLFEWYTFDTEAEAVAWLDACFTTEPTVVTEGS